MNVILLKDVEKLGHRGEVVNVARGYARNFLLPRNLAEVATEGRVKEVQRIEAQKAMHEARSAEQAAEIAATLGKLVLRFDVKSGPTGSLFGSVTTTDIADEIWRIRKIRVDRRKIGIDNIKRIGRYTVTIGVFEGVSADVKLMVVPEGGELPPEEELAAMIAAEEAEAAAAAEAAGVKPAVGRGRVGDRRGRRGAVEVAEPDGTVGRRRGRDGRDGRGDEGSRPKRARGRARSLGSCPGGSPIGSRRDVVSSTGPVDRRPDFPLRSGDPRWITVVASGEKPSAPGDRMGTHVPFSLHLAAATALLALSLRHRLTEARDRCSQHAVGDRAATEPGGGGVRSRRHAAVCDGDRCRHRGAPGLRLLSRVARHDLPGGARALRQGRAGRCDHARERARRAQRARARGRHGEDRRARSCRSRDLERRALRPDRQGDGDAPRPRARRPGDPASRPDPSRRDDRSRRPRRADGVRARAGAGQR